MHGYFITLSGDWNILINEKVTYRHLSIAIRTIHVIFQHCFTITARMSEWLYKATQIAKFMGPTWDPPGPCRPQMGPMLAHEHCYQGRVTASPNMSQTSQYSPSVVRYTQMRNCKCALDIAINTGQTDVSITVATFAQLNDILCQRGCQITIW